MLPDAAIAGVAGLDGPGLAAGLASLHTRGVCASAAARVAERGDHAAAWAVLRSPACPPPALRLAAGQGRAGLVASVGRTASWHVRQIAKTPTRAAAARAAAAASRFQRSAAATDLCTPAAMLGRLSVQPDSDTAQLAGWNPSLAAGWLQPLAASPVAVVRLRANPKCPHQVLRQAADSSDYTLRHDALRNPNCPTDLIDAALGGNGGRAAIADDPLAAANPSLAPQRVRDLAARECEQTRRNAAQNPNLPADAAQRLVLEFPYEMSHNPSCPPEFLERLAANSGQDIRMRVAVNHACPPDTLKRLAHDDEWPVRSWVATRSQDPATLGLLANDCNSWVRCAAAGQHLCPPDSLLDVAEDHAVAVRAAAAANVATPQHALRLLANDADTDVATAAAATLRLQPTRLRP